MVELPFQDSYQNLSVKTAHMMQWPDSQGMRCRFIVKSDDDVYMYPARLRAALESLPREGMVYAGVWAPSFTLCLPAHTLT